MSAYQTSVEDGQTLDLSTPLAGPAVGSQQQQFNELAASQHDGHQAQQTEPSMQQDDYLTASLKQHFLTDIASFFQAEVAPRSAAISEDVANLQYEADQLASKAAHEKATVLGELDRMHKLVAAFQAQIREALMAE